MKQEHKDKIQEIIGGMQCPKKFKCASSGFEELCKARKFSLEGYLDCIDEEKTICPFAIPFGNGWVCHCPLRCYLAKKLGK